MHNSKHTIEAIKRAMLKRAYTQNVVGKAQKPLAKAKTAPSTPKQDPMNLPASHIENVPRVQMPKPIVPEVTQPKANSFSDQDVNGLAHIPLSNITPKQQWESQLHDIMGKKPIGSESLGISRPFVDPYYIDGPGQENASRDFGLTSLSNHRRASALIPEENAQDHLETLLNAQNYVTYPERYAREQRSEMDRLKQIWEQQKALKDKDDAIKHSSLPAYVGSKINNFLRKLNPTPSLAPTEPILEPPPQNIDELPLGHPVRDRHEHVKAIAEHLKKYDPSWGEHFRIPVHQHSLPFGGTNVRQQIAIPRADLARDRIKYFNALSPTTTEFE